MLIKFLDFSASVTQVVGILALVKMLSFEFTLVLPH